MEGRALRILAVLLVGAVVLFWFVRPKKTRLAMVEAGILPAGVDSRIEGVALYQEGPKRELVLRAKSGEWKRKEETFLLHGVEIDIAVVSSSGGPSGTGHISGERGNAKTTGKQLALEGAVIAEGFDGYRLETSDVRYDHDAKLVTTDKPVKLNGPGLNVSGKGATMDYERQTLEIRGRVKAHAVPVVLKDQAAKSGIDMPKEGGGP